MFTLISYTIKVNVDAIEFLKNNRLLYFEFGWMYHKAQIFHSE